MTKAIIAAALTLIGSGATLAADSPSSYANAKAMWLKSRNTEGYQNYAAEFSQFNNHFHLDEKDGCYSLAAGPVNLMLVISHPKNSEFAVIERVLSDADNAKARCFEKSYRGVQTKIPPFLPFVLQMSMG
jgi:hypothetical protein